MTGTYSAYLNATSFSQLAQGIVLSSTTGSIIASWKDQVNICDGSSNPYYISGLAPTYRVVAREANGSEHVLYSVSGAVTSATGIVRSADITALAGKTITLAFEQKSAHDSYRECFSILDDVSVKDSITLHEYVQNGTFELGNLTSWTMNTPAESHNVTTGTRPVAGLNVTRSFYAAPNKLWGRWVDVIANPSVSTAITATVQYQSSLGSLGCGIIYSSPATTPRAVTSWDGAAFDRDIGWVFGSKATVSFTSDSTYDCLAGSPFIDVAFPVTIAAGAKIAIVNFIIMDGTDTGALSTTVDITAKATEIDSEIAKIMTDFWTDNQYRNGMTQDQISVIHNF